MRPFFQAVLQALCALGVVGVTCLGGCATTTTSSPLNYGDNARTAYARALEDFYDNDCIAAEPAFRNVRRQYPYTRFAALAELRVADCLYKAGKSAESIQAFEQFVRYRPSHVEVSYARFMIALANFDQIPGEWLLSPPTYEREQHFTQEALKLLRRFLLDFPDDPLQGRAKRMAQKAIRLLASHELYVARFYLRDDEFAAAAGRLRTLINSYPGSGYDAEALLLLGETYLELKQWKDAKDAFLELTTRFPSSEDAGSARDHLAKLGAS